MSLIEPAELLSKLVNKGADVVDDRASGWVDELLDEGRDFVSTNAPAGESAESGLKVLDIIETNKTPFLRLGKVGLAKVVGHFGSDDEEAAKNVYIAHKATYSERRAWMQGAGDMVQKDREERDAAWEEVKAVLKQIGTIGLKLLAKILLKSLGL